MNLEVEIDKELRGRARLGLLLLDGVEVRASEPALQAEIESYARELRQRHASARSGDVPDTQGARALYKAIGIDPTKTRPSNEALLRRVLKGEALYVVNTLVDALNLVSLRTQLPFGLYDAGQIQPPIAFRKGRPGESYEGIRKGAVNLDGRPVLADGVSAFGNPSADSLRTSVGPQTRSALVVAFAPAACADRRLAEVLDLTEATLVRFCGGTAMARTLS